MRIYKYSEARQNFSTVLNTALKEEVIITRKDGNRFRLAAIDKKNKKSPLDVEGIDTDITTGEIIDVIRECREGSDYFKNKYK
ncbi:MAG: type II toxin-antitoxin system Phd/YefM family antitoxin [Spirochaetaceae bacterium]|jgi:antitoxin (DNA-binding transcriptional repressor) of toxin-antitoxin stability system|nr:type II toxin-antitoxin system Phd/YefM family antitoxin [Spirochaetaceae bacterium]